MPGTAPRRGLQDMVVTNLRIKKETLYEDYNQFYPSIEILSVALLLSLTNMLSLTPSLNHNFAKLRLCLNSSKFRTESALVNPSATWSLEEINLISKSFLATLSLTK